MQVQRHAPIREQVAAILRNAILDMRLMPGQLLIERELCEMTSASRPSVREALRQLEGEGLVESQNGRGTFVSVASPELARHVYVVRAELEGLAAELFTLHADADERQRFASAVKELAAAVRVAEPDQHMRMLSLKNDVYEILFAGAHNPVVQQMVETLQRRVHQLRALTLAQPGRAEASVAEILEIQEAIEAGDAARARERAAAHVTQAATIVLSILEETPNPFSA